MARDRTALPGKPGPDGRPVLDRQHLARLLNCLTHWLDRNANKEMLAASSLPIADAAYLSAPIRCQLDGEPWRPRPITFAEAPHLIRYLSTACAVVLAYLSGARPGEVLSWRRGCVRHDPTADLWLLQGRKWKGAVDENGDKKPQGEERTDPWVVVKQVADAVAVLERLRDRDLLFLTTLFDTRVADALQYRIPPLTPHGPLFDAWPPGPLSPPPLVGTPADLHTSYRALSIANSMSSRGDDLSAHIDIDPAPVMRAAADMQAASTNSRRGFLLDDATSAGAGHPRWQASAASAQCVTAWQDRLRREADEVEAAAKALAASANNYVTTDRATADALSQDANWLKGA